MIYPTISSNFEICAQNMVGRNGLIWFFRWVHIRISSFSYERVLLFIDIRLWY